MKHRSIRTFSLFACLFGLAPTAHAWNPNEGADAVNAPAPRHYDVMPPAPRPKPMQAPAAYAPVAAAYTPPPALAMAPPPPPPAPPIASAPVYVPPVPEPVYTPTAAPIVAAPVAVASYSDTPPATSTTYRTNRYKLGIEGFYDRYQEPDVTVDSRSGYGSLTFDGQHYFTPNWFGELDLRESYGKEHYHSISGNSDGNDQWEFDNRILAGYDADYLQGRHFKPYIGLGTRYYRDEGKNEVTDLGFIGYDRRIFQLYMPIGLAYEFPAWGMTFTPRFEYAPLLYGNVSTRLGNVPGYYNIENDQHGGNSIRVDMMMSQLDSRGYGWEFGPFLRTWNVRDSKVTTDPSGGEWVEPHNTRLQAGAALRFLF